MTEPKKNGLDLLRVEFPAHQVGKLPRGLKKDDQDKGRCDEGSRYSSDGVFCGGWHARSIHLDFVGHAALTDRLLDADPEWSWEPVAFGPDGLPAFDRNGGLWIRLTICGVTRLGYGDAQGKSGPNGIKEAIGDALRNAGMRFGAALDLWHKGDLHAQTEQEPADRKADRAKGTPEDDPFYAPAGETPPTPPESRITDQEWFEGYLARVESADSATVLRGLHSEAAEQHRFGKLTKADLDLAGTALTTRKETLDRLATDPIWPTVTAPGSAA